MCRSTVEKEDVFITQNALGSNAASVQELKYHLSAISIVLIVICTILGFGVIYVVYKLYKRCHMAWIREETMVQNLRRSFRRSDPGLRDPRMYYDARREESAAEMLRK